MTNSDIISKFQPELLIISNLEELRQASDITKLLIYGEIHGIRENADIIYTLVRRLNIRRIAIENSPSVSEFIDAAIKGTYNFSLIDTDTFDSSILSLEVAKTLAVLVYEGHLDEVVYIDTYFDNLGTGQLDHPDSPQKREQDLADSILALDTTRRTMCLMGQWHTKPKPVHRKDITHYSALYRIRQVEPTTPFVHIIYKKGNTRNDGKILKLPERSDVLSIYSVQRISDIDFDLHVPVACHSLFEPNC